MNILITGGTGFIGSHLSKALIQKEHQVTILSRSKKSSSNRFITYKPWDGKKMPMGMGIYDVVINLAGASLADGRWTESNKKKIMDSRINATRACVHFINSSPNPPKLFFSASGVGYYGIEKTDEIDERARPGNDFPARVCKRWEEEANEAKCRIVIARIGVVLGRDGGAMNEMLPIYKRGLGGRFAAGNQGFPWIHIRDVIKVVETAIENEEISGPLNVVAPHVVDQATFSRLLSRTLGKNDIFVIPKFALKVMFGEKSLLFYGGQKAIPRKLQEKGFIFEYPDLRSALREVIKGK